MIIRLISLFSICIIIFNNGCVPPPKPSKGEINTDFSPKIKVTNADTLTYSIEFFNQTEKDDFVKAFKKFMESCTFSSLSFDSTYNQINIRIIGGNSSNLSGSISTIQKTLFSEDIIEGTNNSGITTNNNAIKPPSLLIETDSNQPDFGGTLRIYSHRSFIDQTLSQFTLPEIFDCISDSGICTFVDTTPQKITIRINDKVINARNRTISTLDLIQEWTSFVKSNPAEGIALFSGVSGIGDFIAGKEGLIRGFNPIDQKTLQIRYDSPQPLAVTRLSTPNLFVPSLFLGPYYQEKTGNEIVLLPDTNVQKRKAFLDKIALKTGGDPNPVLSFSLNKFDALITNSLNDISYARSTLADKVNLHKLSSDRYFIACNIKNPQVGSSLSSIINPEALLKNYLKVEGSVITSTSSNHAITQITKNISTPLPTNSATIRILYCKDDFLSKSIAEKLLAGCSNVGISSTLIAKNVADYERVLVSGEYDCAVGWVAESILYSQNEKLRLAAIWFNNDADEEKRIQEFREIPLFSVNTYLCARKNIQLYKNDLRGIYISKEPLHSGN